MPKRLFPITDAFKALQNIQIQVTEGVQIGVGDIVLEELKAQIKKIFVTRYNRSYRESKRGSEKFLKQKKIPTQSVRIFSRNI